MRVMDLLGPEILSSVTFPVYALPSHEWPGEISAIGCSGPPTAPWSIRILYLTGDAAESEVRGVQVITYGPDAPEGPESRDILDERSYSNEVVNFARRFIDLPEAPIPGGVSYDRDLAPQRVYGPSSGPRTPSASIAGADAFESARFDQHPELRMARMVKHEVVVLLLSWHVADDEFAHIACRILPVTPGNDLFASPRTGRAEM